MTQETVAYPPRIDMLKIVCWVVFSLGWAAGACRYHPAKIVVIEDSRATAATGGFVAGAGRLTTTSYTVDDVLSPVSAATARYRITLRAP